MDSERTYWDAIEKYEKQITKLTFQFAKPNMLKGRARIDDFNKAAFDGGADTIEHTHASDTAGKLNANSDVISSSADIAIEGGAEADIYITGNKKVWSSSKDHTSDTIEEEIMPTVEDQTFVQAVIERLFKNLFKPDA